MRTEKLCSSFFLARKVGRFFFFSRCCLNNFAIFETEKIFKCSWSLTLSVKCFAFFSRRACSDCMCNGHSSSFTLCIDNTIDTNAQAHTNSLNVTE